MRPLRYVSRSISTVVVGAFAGLGVVLVLLIILETLLGKEVNDEWH